MHLLIRFIVNAIVLWLIINFVPTYDRSASFGIWHLVLLIVIFGLVNMLIGPILRLLSAPINWLTHGIFSIVINWILLALAVWITPGIHAAYWYTNLIGAIVLMVVSTLIAMIWNPDQSATAV